MRHGQKDEGSNRALANSVSQNPLFSFAWCQHTLKKDVAGAALSLKRLQKSIASKLLQLASALYSVSENLSENSNKISVRTNFFSKRYRLF